MPPNTSARRAIVTKMHGSHNTFVLLDGRSPAGHADTITILDEPLKVTDAGVTSRAYVELARTLCAADGPMSGADGLLVLSDAADANDADVAVQIVNADGGEAEMCGNGMRCVARYLWERGAGDAFALETRAGRITATVTAREPFEATIDVGAVTFPRAAEEERLDVAGHTWRYYDVSVGNPHAVVFATAVEDVTDRQFATIGNAFKEQRRFPDGVNVHVVQPVDAQTLRVRHYERGAGLTAACGTGAVACAAAAIVTRGYASPVTVCVPGGTLHVAWQSGTSARLSGPAVTLFEREITW
ncbi:MAG: diaminopimelate epimerase [Candidatus Eremiobacteraeota bacterium]|nr:diaminopimelate epimerase [Candidatus Eremiobacteraeota bacterium]